MGVDQWCCVCQPPIVLRMTARWSTTLLTPLTAVAAWMAAFRCISNSILPLENLAVADLHVDFGQEAEYRGESTGRPLLDRPIRNLETSVS